MFKQLVKRLGPVPVFLLSFHLKSFHISNIRLIRITTSVSMLYQNNNKPQEKKKKKEEEKKGTLLIELGLGALSTPIIIIIQRTHIIIINIIILPAFREHYVTVVLQW